MSDFDWQSFFVDLSPEEPEERTKVALSIFDAPEAVEAKPPKPEKPEKKEKAEEPPKAVQPKSIFDAPTEKPPAPGEEEAGKWVEFLNLFYEGGKKKVKNPNPKTEKKYPEVQVSTALKDPAFAGKIKKEFEAWLQQAKDVPTQETEDAPFQEGDVAYSKGVAVKVLGVEKNQYGGYNVKVEHDGDVYSINSNYLKSQPPEDEEEKKGPGPLADLKKGDKFYEEGHEDEPLTVKDVVEVGDQTALVSENGTYYYEDEVALDEEGKVKKPEDKPEDKPKPLVGTTIDDLDDIVPGIYFKNAWGTVGKVTSMLPDGGFRYRQFDKISGKWKGTEKIDREAAEDFFSSASFTVVDDPKKKIPEGASTTDGHEVTAGDTVWVDGDPHKVKQVELDEDKHGNKFLLDDGTWVNMHDVDQPELAGAHSWVYSKSGDPEPGKKPEPGEKMVDRAQLQPGVVVTNHGKPGYNKTWKISEVLPSGDVLYHKLKSDGTWTKKTYKLSPTWIDLFMADKNYEFIEDPAKKKPKKEKADVGDKVTSPAQLEEGDFIQSTAAPLDPYIGKITEVHGPDQPLGEGVYVQDYDPETNKLTGKPWWISAFDLDDGYTTKVKAPKVKKGLTGKDIKDPKKLKEWDVLRVHEYDSGKVYTAQVVTNDDGWVVYNIVNAKTGKIKDTRTVSPQTFKEELQVSRVPKSKIPKKLKKEPPEEGTKDPFLLVMKDHAKKELAKAKSDAKEEKLEEDAEHPVPQPEKKKEKEKGKTKKVDKDKWKLETHHVDWDDIKAGDMVHTKEYGPQRVVDRTASGVRLESGVVLTKGKLEKEKKKFVVSRGDKPQKPKAPKPPERPTGKPVKSPDQVDKGDVIEYEHNGVTYRGQVVSWDEPGEKFRVRIIYPPEYVAKYESYNEETGEKTYKTPSFDQAKIDKRNPRLLTKEQMESYDEAVEKYTKKLKEIDKQYAEDVAEYEAAMAGKEEVHTGPLKNVEAPESWNHGSTIARDADRFFEQYKEMLGDKVENVVKNMTAGKSYYHGSSEMWDEMSEGERKLAQSAHKAASEFKKLLTPQENSAWTAALSSWQGSSGAMAAHKLMGGLENLGVEGGPKSWEAGNVQHYREEGRQNDALHRALAKAMAYSQLVYDALGVDHVTVYRGTQTKPVKGAPQGKEITTNTARELASFSIDPQVAYNFAGGGKRVVKYRVPVSRLFISPVTYASLATAVSPYSENEYLVAGQDGLVGKVMPKSMYQYSPKKMKLASHERRPLFGPVFDDDVLVIEFTPEDDDWLRSPVKDTWWPDHCRKCMQRAEEHEPRVASRILRLARQNPVFRRELIAALTPRRKGATTIFDVPRKKAAVSIFDPPSSQGAPEQTESSEDEGFDAWFSEHYDGGKKKVQNPNPKTKNRYPEVAASTAMKDKTFAQKVYAEYEKSKGEPEAEEEAPAQDEAPQEGSAQETVKLVVGDAWADWADIEISDVEEKLKGELGDAYKEEHLVSALEQLRERAAEQVEAYEDDPHNPQELDAWEGSVEALDAKIEELTGKKRAPEKPSDLEVGDQIRYTYKGKEMIGKVVSTGDDGFKALVYHPKTGKKLRTKPVSFDAEKMKDRKVERADDWHRPPPPKVKPGTKLVVPDEDLDDQEIEVSDVYQDDDGKWVIKDTAGAEWDWGEGFKVKSEVDEMEDRFKELVEQIKKDPHKAEPEAKKLKEALTSYLVDNHEKISDKEFARVQQMLPALNTLMVGGILWGPKSEAPKSEDVLDVDSDEFKQVGPQTGSNPGGLYEAEDGTRYYVKTPKTQDRARNEILAAKLYDLAGIDVPEIEPAVREGKFSVASKIIPGLSEDSSALRKGKVPGVLEGIAVDAWLGNWDVVGLGYDNLLVDEEGRGRRVDTGGALRYRAMGAPKGDAFGDEVTELEIFTDPDRKAGSVFHHATPQQIVDSIDRVLEIPKDKIRELVDQWGPKGKKKDELFKTLLARRESLKKQREKYAKKAAEKKASARVLRLALMKSEFRRALIRAASAR